MTFDIDANGILNVTAKDKGSGKDQKITISGSSGLDKDEVDRLQKEAEKHAEEDKKRKEAVETRNELDNMVYQAEKLLKEDGDKVSADNKSNLEAAIESSKKTLDDQQAETATLKADKEKLLEALNAAGQEIHAAGGAAGDPGAAAGGPDVDPGPAADAGENKGPAGAKDADVVDADFEVVEDEKDGK